MLLGEVHSVSVAPASARSDIGSYFPDLYRPIIRPEPEMNNGASFSNDGYFYAPCESVIDEGDCVYEKGPGNYVGLASAANPFPVVGVCVKKTATNQCIVQRYGTIRSIYKGLLPQARYLLGIDGKLVSPPLKDSRIVFAQQIGMGLSTGELYLQPTGQIYKITVGDDDPQPDMVSVESGEPHMYQTYPSENVYIDQLTGDWYTMPTGSDGASHFFVSFGPPSDSATYSPKSVYVDKNTGAYYISPDQGSTFVPISGGEGEPNEANPPKHYRVVFVNQDDGMAYYS